MSTLEVSNLNDGTTTVATTFITNGSVKASAFVNGTGTPSITYSLNASSVTDNGSGDYTVAWTNSFNTWFDQVLATDASYTQSIGGPFVVSSYYNSSTHIDRRQVRCGEENSGTLTLQDCEGVCLSITGDLA